LFRKQYNVKIIYYTGFILIKGYKLKYTILSDDTKAIIIYKKISKRFVNYLKNMGKWVLIILNKA
jgi:hypothetical protein